MGTGGRGETLAFVKVGDKDSLAWAGGRAGGRRYTDVRPLRRPPITGFRAHPRSIIQESCFTSLGIVSDVVIRSVKVHLIRYGKVIL